MWGVLSGPRGNAFSAGASDTATGVSDLYPMASLKWQTGSHNVMTYIMGSAPVGAYDPNRWAGVVKQAVYSGSSITYRVDVGTEIVVFAQNQSAQPLAPGTAVAVSWSPLHSVVVED